MAGESIDLYVTSEEDDVALVTVTNVEGMKAGTQVVKLLKNEFELGHPVVESDA